MAGSVAISQPNISRAIGIAKINIAVPVGEPRSPLGVFAGSLRIDRIATIAEALHYGEGSYAFVLDSTGRAIAHPNPALNFNVDRPEVPSLTESSDPGLAELAQLAVAGGRGVERRRIGGQEYYAAYLPLQEADWSIVLLVPRRNLEVQLAPLDRVAAVAGLLAVALAIALWFWQRQAAARRQLLATQQVTARAKAELEARVAARTAELSQALEDLKAAQLQLIHSEKMSSLGQLVAGIAHEINNPVNFIYGNLLHADEYARRLLAGLAVYQREAALSATAIADLEDLEIEFIAADLPKLLDSMRSGTERIRSIVQSLRVFSRLDEAARKTVDLHLNLDSTLALLQRRLQAAKGSPPIAVETNYGDLPLVECYASELNQVFLNILTNAIEAIEARYRQQTPAEQVANPGCIRLTTRVVESMVEVAIADNGCGIPASVRPKIFEPFFTTKPVGQGMGLGLALSYAIVTSHHNGSLTCHSEPGRGTEFALRIPLTPQPPAPAEPAATVLAASAGREGQG